MARGRENDGNDGVGSRGGEVASAVGRGLAAGLFGTVVMTVGQTIEMSIQDHAVYAAATGAAYAWLSR